ncbi:MAG: UTP--glucose-1-phosphate uridylyltransferase GalU [Pseudomonadota bacterium]
MKPLRKVVIPVAGLGTRVLPATKTIPKEMLTVVDKPLIDYNLAEAREAGIEHFVLVNGRGKTSIEDYFDHAFELEATLEAKKKTAILEQLQASQPQPGEVSAVRQQRPLGLGHAVWCARDIIGDEPFAVLLPDEIVTARPGYLAQMVEAYNKTGGNLVAVEEVPNEETKKYGVIKPKDRTGNLIEMTGMVEKPDPADAPSNFRIIGRYVLQPEIFPLLAEQSAGAGGEIQLTDAMDKLMASQPFHAVICEGAIYDCGSKIGWLKANVSVALERDDLREDFAEFLKGLPA